MARVVAKALAAGLLVGLAGCQTGAQQQFAQADRGFVEANAKRMECMAPVLANPAFEAIARRTARPPAPFARPALERLGDPDKVSDAEVPLIMARFDAVSLCQEAWAAAIARLSPARAAVHRELGAEVGQVYLRLLRREITWGEANQRGDALLVRADERSRAAGASEGAQLQSQHNAELAQRQASAAAMSVALQQQQAQMQAQQQAQQQQQMINAITRPVTTSCRRLWDTVNCTTN